MPTLFTERAGESGSGPFGVMGTPSSEELIRSHSPRRASWKQGCRVGSQAVVTVPSNLHPLGHQPPGGAEPLAIPGPRHTAGRRQNGSLPSWTRR